MFRQTVFFALALLPFSLAQVSEDFEKGWDEAAWPIYAPDSSQGGSSTGGNVSLDSTTAHSGKNSMKVTGAAGYSNHMFFGTTKVPSGDMYVRVYVKATKPLTDSHVTFIVMPDSAQSAGGKVKHLRMGGQSKVLDYNRESDDATLPSLSPQGIASSAALPVGSWQCIEYHLGSDGSIETWLNDTAVAGLTTAASNTNADQWRKASVKPKPTGVYFGWESYGGDANTFWFDDISIASTRVGCSGSNSSVARVIRSDTRRKSLGG